MFATYMHALDGGTGREDIGAEDHIVGRDARGSAVLGGRVEERASHVPDDEFHTACLGNIASSYIYTGRYSI